MGRKSTREGKSVYQLAREQQGLSRERAAERMPGLGAERIEKIESGRTAAQPEDVMMMAAGYKSPALCNYYCTHECAIGREKIAEIEEKSLAQIAIETLNAVNRLERERDRLLEIVEDGRVRPDEQEDFLRIRAALEKMAGSIDSLRLWVDQQVAEGKMEKES